MGFYSPASIIYEGQRHGVEFEDVDIAESEWDCTIVERKVRLGFRMVKGLGNPAQEQIEPERQKRPFSSIRDFVFRTNLNRAGLEQLAMVGAFRSFGATRRQALWEVLALLNRTDGELPVEEIETGMARLKPMNQVETMVSDYRGLGLSTLPHLISLMRDKLEQQGILSAIALHDHPNNRLVTTAGVVVIRQRPMTAKGFLFITLEDETGFSNIVVKPKVFERHRKTIVHNQALIVKGLLEKKDGVVNVIGHDFQPLTIMDKPVKLKSRDFR
jgi:error-prone DNA polymerase